MICRRSRPSRRTDLAERVETNPRSGLGLRAGADATQPAHALAGRPLRSRPRRQPPPDHGPLTLAVAVRAHPRTAPSRPLEPRGNGSRHPHPSATPIVGGSTYRTLQSQRPFR
ncbi:MAG: hypothetical protein MZV70_07675 [Desulfobacterales bacterium]|nr:hypothetical protein [Desulfobacterales bacterium]